MGGAGWDAVIVQCRCTVLMTLPAYTVSKDTQHIYVNTRAGMNNGIGNSIA